MSEQYAWRLVVTDENGSREAVSEETLANPYVSDESAQHVAERLLSALAPGYLAADPKPHAVTVDVWRHRTAKGDPIATAEWTPAARA